jgi:inhibitor of the pro-sigma K processing machinery
MLGRLVARLLVAAVALYLLNQFGSFIDFRLAINPITVAVTGILGIPGLLSLILIKYFIVQ